MEEGKDGRMEEGEDGRGEEGAEPRTGPSGSEV